MEANKENQQSIEQAFEQALDAYKAGNFAEAAGQWLALAEDGCAPAQRALGSLYERGPGVEKNAENAFEWTKKAAEQYDPVAMFNLACYHDKGFGVKKNQQTALTWYRKAAEYGHPEAAALIASLIETGDRGLEKDMNEAVRWYQIAANRGNVLAMGRLAWLYSTGTGVPQDAAFAFQYFLKAAQGGNAACMMNTAILYARGEGTPHNAHEALYWAEQAKKHGAPQAEQLQFHALTGTSLRAFVQARRPALALPAVRDGKQRLLDIALDCDFSSQEAFTRAFRAAYGITPGEYRRSPRPLSLRTVIRPLDCYLAEQAPAGTENDVQTYFITLPSHKFAHIRNYESIG